ncbi:molybdopterin-dependent oxidoreductase [Nocardioides sp.]|uniref:molybdopterin-dependent oxidoreductase n=1 Tax=Nocardioides sp. TaxID=35761 RepID=UPI00351504F7
MNVPVPSVPSASGPVPRGRAALLGVLLTVVVAALLGGCGSDAAPAPSPTDATSAVDLTVVSEASLRPGDAVPPPTGPVLLTVRGGTTTNVGEELQLDRDLLERLGVMSYEVQDDDATGQLATFSGPLVRDLLAVAGGDATMMHAVALNDYVVDVPVKDAQDLPLLLATRMDGKPMSVANYGPTRFVYPSSGYDLDPAVYDPRAIWQLATITLK